MRLAILFLLSACTPSLTVGVVAPRPSINLGVSTQRLTLMLPTNLPDNFDLDCGGCVIHVGGFRQSLQNGYLASFQRFHPFAGADADLFLKFSSVMLEVGEDQHLRVRYGAQLDDRSGRTLGRSFGTLTGRRIWSNEEAALEDLLTKMYEKIAADCFVPLSITRER